MYFVSKYIKVGVLENILDNRIFMLEEHLALAVLRVPSPINMKLYSSQVHIKYSGASLDDAADERQGRHAHSPGGTRQ